MERVESREGEESKKSARAKETELRGQDVKELVRECAER